MQLIGNTLKFAVRYELDADYGGVWMYGKFSYLCNGQEVGDYELGTSLRDVLFQLDELTKFNCQMNSRFGSMPAKDLFEMIDSALSGTAIDSVQKIANEEQWRNFCIFPAVDVFDGWKGFLINSETGSRIVFSNAPYAEVKEINVDNSELELIFGQVRKELNEIYERELD